jgi:hypothetical protein
MISYTIPLEPGASVRHLPREGIAVLREPYSGCSRVTTYFVGRPA